MREINAAGRTLVKRFEGIKDGDPTTVNLDPYLDDVGVWTIGWGHAIVDPKTKTLVTGIAGKARAYELYPGGITMAQAEALLTADLLDACSSVIALVKVPLDDAQFAAVVSFEFNLGALAGSTLLKLLNQGDYESAAEQFDVWVKGRVKGVLKVLPGLVARRAAERQMFEHL